AVHRHGRGTARGVLSTLGLRPALGFARALDAALRLRAQRRGIFHDARNPIVRLGVHCLRLRPDDGAGVGPGPAAIAAKAYLDGRDVRRTARRVWGLPLFHREGEECGVNPEPFLQIDRVIHEKGRLGIMSMLAASPELSFTELRDVLEMTDGNL